MSKKNWFIANNPNYWRDRLYMVVNSVSVSETLSTPPAMFDELGKAKWLDDLNLTLSELVGQKGIIPIELDNKKDLVSHLHGPFDIHIDYSNKAKSFILEIKSISTSETLSYKVKSRDIRRLADEYRENFLSPSFQDSVKSSTQSVIYRMEEIRHNHHRVAAKEIQNSFYKAGVRVEFQAIATDLFTLFQMISPMSKGTGKKMARAYSPYMS